MGGMVVSEVVGAPGQKMVYNDSHFPALSSLATAAAHGFASGGMEWAADVM